jgi:ERCC4-related helicase
VRNRPALVRAVVPRSPGTVEGLHEVQVEYIDGWSYPANDFVIWEVEQEHGARVVSSLAMPRIDDLDLELDHPELLQAFLYANQWSAVNQLRANREEEEQAVRLVSPWQSAIQVEDYQLYPLLKAMLMPRISLLLADDVGLGKTIEAGLILSELYVRRRIRRALIICPASLQLQWRDEMREKFHLDFTIVDREETFRLQRDLGVDSNPWASHPRVITSMDYLRQEDILASFMAATQMLAGHFEDILPWQMLVVDEVHNLAPSRFGDNSQRCQMLRAITPWFEHRLFLSATPHNGHTLAFTGLLELLDPVRFQQKYALTEHDHQQIALTMVRRLKSDLNEEGEAPRFAERQVKALDIRLHEEEKQLFAALRAYREGLHALLRGQKNRREQHLGEFLMKLLTKRLLSSSYAFARTWWRHVEGLTKPEEDDLAVMEHAVERAETVMNDDEERSQREEDAIKQTGTWVRRYANQLQTERQNISDCLETLGWSHKALQQGLQNLHALPADARWERLMEWIDEHIREETGAPGKNERLVIFTEYKDTLDYLIERLRRQELESPQVECLYGGASSRERELIKDAFNDPLDPLRILVGTDTISEGINLQATCRYVIHQEIPWNPMRMEQRNGRVDRHGQEREVWAYHFASDNEADLKFMAGVVDKVKQARNDLGSVGQVIDSSVEAYFTQGLSQKEFESRVEQAQRETKEPHDLQASDKGRDMRVNSALAMQQLRKTEDALDLSPRHVEQVLERAAWREDGALKEEAEKDVYVFAPVPPTWKKLVKETLERRDRAAAGLRKLVFSPGYFEKRNSQNGLLIFKPRTDRELIRLGHPLMQRALGTLRRKMWERKGDRKDLSRWTVRGYDDLPHNTAAVLLLHLYLEVTNEFREVAHQEVICRAFEVRGNLLIPYDEHLVKALHDRFELPDEVKDTAIPHLRELWLEHDPQIRKLIQKEHERCRKEFSKMMQQRHKEEEAFEKRVFAERLRELEQMKEPPELRKLRRESEHLEKRIKQLKEKPFLFEEFEQERLPALEQAEERRKEVEWDMQAVNLIDSMKQLVSKEQERILKKVLPRRYTLASVDIQPLTVEYVVRATRKERQ